MQCQTCHVSRIHVYPCVHVHSNDFVCMYIAMTLGRKQPGLIIVTWKLASELPQGFAALKLLLPLNYNKKNYVKHGDPVKRYAACSFSVTWRHCLKGTPKGHSF